MIKWMISSSCLILIMIVVRRLFKGRISPSLQYALWLLVAIRLIVPVSLGSSVLSVENFTNQISIQKQEEVNENAVIQEKFNNSTDKIKVYDSIETMNINKNAQFDFEESSAVPKENVVSLKSTFKIDVSDIFLGVWLI